MTSVRLFLSLFGLAFVMGCATPMHEVVRNDINYGDSEERVRELLGEPTSFSTSPITRKVAWTYQSSGAVCELKFEDRKVEDMSCDASNYVSSGSKVRRAFGMMLKGAGDGIKESTSRPQMRCRPDLLGGYNCQ